MLTMLGIPNCDTVKKARLFLAEQDVAFTFRDVRAMPLSREEWLDLLKADVDRQLINTRGPSFRKTGVPVAALSDPECALAVLLAQPSAMKRPVMLRDGSLLSIGFSEDRFRALTT